MCAAIIHSSGNPLLQADLAKQTAKRGALCDGEPGMLQAQSLTVLSGMRDGSKSQGQQCLCFHCINSSEWKCQISAPQSVRQNHTGLTSMVGRKMAGRHPPLNL